MKKFIVMLVVALVFTFAGNFAAMAENYEVTWLPNADEDSNPESRAYGINENSYVVGEYGKYSLEYGIYNQAAIWDQNGTPMPLESPVPGKDSFALKINENNWVAGYYRTSSGYNRAIIWRPDGSFINLAQLLGSQESSANAINDLGKVVGRYSTSAFMYDVNDGAVTFLSSLGTYTSAYDINNLNQIVGRYSYANIFHPFIWDQGTMHDLVGIPPEIPAINQSHSAIAINDSGWVVGQSTYTISEPMPFLFATFGKAWLWHQDLAPSPIEIESPATCEGRQYKYMMARNINNLGQVVGFYECFDVSQEGQSINGIHGPFIYADGLTQDFRSEISPQPFEIGNPNGMTINDKGEIAGGAMRVIGLEEAFKLTLLCGNGVLDAGEACDTMGDIGCANPTLMECNQCRSCDCMTSCAPGYIHNSNCECVKKPIVAVPSPGRKMPTAEAPVEQPRKA